MSLKNLHKLRLQAVPPSLPLSGAAGTRASASNDPAPGDVVRRGVATGAHCIRDPSGLICRRIAALLLCASASFIHRGPPVAPVRPLPIIQSLPGVSYSTDNSPSFVDSVGGSYLVPARRGSSRVSALPPQVPLSPHALMTTAVYHRHVPVSLHCWPRGTD